MNNITIIGIGRLGLGLGLILEKIGYNVLGIDKNKDYVEQLNNKTFLTDEPEYNTLLKESKHFKASSDLKCGLDHSQFIFILVQTPNGGGNRFYDHNILSNLLSNISDFNPCNKHFIICATIMPKYIDEIGNFLLNINPISNDNNNTLSYNPEFVAQGEIIKGYKNPDIILLGTYDKDVKKKIEEISLKIIKLNKKKHKDELEKIILEKEEDIRLLKQYFDNFDNIDNIENNNYDDLLNKQYNFKIDSMKTPKLCVMTPLEAEIVKISLNGFITTKLSFANMISDLCDNLGAKKNIVLEAIGSDSRIGNRYFKPGYSYGGPCFPRDTKALNLLIKQSNLNNDLLEGTTNYNEFHIYYQTKQLLDCNLNNYIIENVCFKENNPVSIIEESAKLKIGLNLIKCGKKVIIKDKKNIIDQVKKEYGNLFDYIIMT